jgi:hypothetical protein
LDERGATGGPGLVIEFEIRRITAAIQSEGLSLTPDAGVGCNAMRSGINSSTVFALSPSPMSCANQATATRSPRLLGKRK